MEYVFKVIKKGHHKEIRRIVKNFGKVKKHEVGDKFFKRSKEVDFNEIDPIQKSVNDRKLPFLEGFVIKYICFPGFLFKKKWVLFFYVSTINFAVKEGTFWIYKRKR